MQYLGLAYELLREQVIELTPTTPGRAAKLAVLGLLAFSIHSCS